MKQMQRKIISLALALFMLSGLFCFPVAAAVVKIENTYPTAVPISVGEKVQVGERQGTDYSNYCDVDMKYKFTVEESCEVTFELSTELHPSGKRYNRLHMQVWCADAKTLLYSYAGEKHRYSIAVRTDGTDPLAEQIAYKIRPGDYYVQVANGTSYNAFGWLEFKSVEAMQDDFGGEPNDTIELAQEKPSIKTGTDYIGNIRYEGQKLIDNRYNEYGTDKYDYYRFDVPNDGYSVKLTAERADKHRDNPIEFSLVDSRDYGTGCWFSLDIFPSESSECKNLKKGTYFVKVAGYSSRARPTEYTFRLDATGETKPPPDREPFDEGTMAYSPSSEFAGTDRYSFVNTYTSFGKTCGNPGQCVNCAVCPRYDVKDSDFEKLAAYVRKEYGEEAAKTRINKLQEARNNKWGGSCYGMSVTAVLDKNKQLDMKGLVNPGVSRLWDLPKPVDNETVKSTINYYQISYRVDFLLPHRYLKANADWSAGLRELVDEAKKDNWIVFVYAWETTKGTSCHAILIHDYEAGQDGSHRLIAYDNRYPDRDIVVKVSGDYKSCVVDGKEDANRVEITSDTSAFDRIAIDGRGKAEPKPPTDLTEISLAISQSATVTNAEGETLVYDGRRGAVSGTMKVYGQRLVAEGGGSGTIVFEVAHSETFTFKTDGEGLDVSVVNTGMYASANSNQANKVVVGKDNGVTVTGSGKVEFNMSLGLNSEICDLVTLSGQTQSGASLWQNAKGAVAKGEFVKSTKLTVTNKVTNVDEHIFSTEKGELLITRVDGRIDVLGSSRGDGVFDESVLGGEGTMANFERTGSYKSGQFADVDENAWYGFNGSKSVADAYEYGLMKGSSATTFRPNGTLTLAEAIAVAVRVHRIYSTGSGSVAAEAVWWQPYVDYVIANEIIEAGDFGGNYERAATRAEMAYIFAQALPSGEFGSQNTVNGLPDVKSGTKYFAEIMTLYRAGVITGSDSAGTFKPNANITRAEAAAIISRVVLPGARVKGRTYG